MENSNRLFRKAAFGGFNKEDVMRYIETMKTEFFEYRAQVEETINDLNEKLSSLQQSGGASSRGAEPNEGDNALSISEAANQLRRVADELVSNLNLLLGRLHVPEASEAVEEETEAAPAEDAPKEETTQDKVESLLRTLFSPEEDTLPQPEQAEKSAEKADVLSVLPHYLSD